ncbi:hypothetical protein C8A05DRAFT_31034 [Staphylotrichum tortipilum]|uniref:Uncharacterized protein n=1 Tax=Staphylotrichum tortipilum TaxID=2831512 RepID=A0AAN6MRC7_9PEZI|nr:hypothetical protein C8A05DRAFT_31034 [Staphylotrichum longicolle]
MMWFVNLVWAVVGILFVGAWAQDNAECTCSGLDYADGGSYLVDGNSENDFTFYSVFQGCFESTITPILVSPNGDGYECSAINSQPDGLDQASSCAITYSELSTGPWSIIIEAPDYGFLVQRQFNLTIGARNDRTVVVTVTPTVYEDVTSTVPGETITSWIGETETQYEEPETIIGDCYSQTDTVIQYIPGQTTKIVSEAARWSTAEANANVTNNVVDPQDNQHSPPTSDNKQQARHHNDNYHDPNEANHDGPGAHHHNYQEAFHDDSTMDFLHKADHGPDNHIDGDTPAPQHDDSPTTVRQGGGGGGGGGGGQQPTTARQTRTRNGDGLEPMVTPGPEEAIARRALAIVTVTSTVYDDENTVTSTVVEIEEGEATTEYNFYTTTTTSTPPPQTVCDAETTVTLLYQGAPQTQYEVTYVTYYTWATVWVRQTQYTTATDYDVMTRCWQGGGYYGV